MRYNMFVKTEGSASGSRQDPIFFSIFLSLKRMPTELAGSSAFPKGFLGSPLAGPESVPLHTITVLARNHFGRLIKVRFEARVEALKGSKLVKYTIRGVFQGFEILKTS